MDGDRELRTTRGVVVPPHALSWTFARASGPGGQNVNKTSTKVTLTIDVREISGPPAAVSRVRTKLGDELRVTSQSSRSQWRNRQLCLEQAAEELDRAAAPPDPARRKSKPTKGAVERRLASKRRESEKKAARRTTEW